MIINRGRDWLIIIMTAFLITGGCFSAFAQKINAFVAPARGFTSWQPAANWEHAMLTGNGTMGAMVMGQPYDETIILSHAALYMPLAQSKKPISQADRLEEIRNLLLSGKNKEAALIPVEQRNIENYKDERDPFIPAFDVDIVQQPDAIHKYQRSVNFETGEAITDWASEKGVFQRKVFVSRKDSVVVISIKGDQPINCSINFNQRPVEWQQSKFVREGIREVKKEAEAEWLTFRSGFKIKNRVGLEGYEGVGRLILKGGNIETKEGKLTIENADEVLLLIKIAPSFDYKNSQLNLLKSALMKVPGDYLLLLKNHAGIHGELFKRVKFNLTTTNDDDNKLNAEELILKAKSKSSKVMIEKAFDAGRYNVISSTGYNPPNLQGIWSGTWTAPWTGGFTNDGNLATAISANLSTNMPELMHSFFNYHERLMDDYRLNANCLYNCRGIHIPAQATTTGWDTDFGETWCLTFWTGAAGWTAGFFYDYYLYTGDKAFLQQHAYPFMKEAALFYEDFMTLGTDGKLVFNPSYSPENNPSNNTSQATLNATMDVMIAKQLLRNCITAAKTLNTDKQKIKQWEAMLAKMPEYDVADDGSFREWLWDGVAENHHHRHTSQLYSLYDHADPDILSKPELTNAVAKTIQEKMKFRNAEGGGEMAFGLVQLGLAASRISDVKTVERIVQWLSSKYWSNGMGSFHNVGGLFNTDISGGLPYLITQMLISAEPGSISILPALPADWDKGSIEGILLRGQVKVNKMEWNGKKIQLKLTSTIDQRVQLQFPGFIDYLTVNEKQVAIAKSYSISLSANKEITIITTLK
ncbi:glycosyl hydrolase family 95 catalytic domain-containing protein [Solitalea canadensis]|uniref:Trehalose/maltose hydrolase or phosphorylase n=1 Tax=Solitalea canadensis (strain ATCC 29591 / DSM 3403 / JCM 21819 / LMG 8368 / NBRC 15130 / NCIMB 12057 / USAM 9D) TaxID=929556 RepID=H8KVR2_SOLCM|nr:glycoside hydrolase N-terminal domain-containing protein [Solitalea canadensis]AFD06685.1 trehalose/maltose hydrolase or phosphorylase [Solitalea canadensis DSM 3403]